jgi:ATP-dependent Clp endopeptidase proteolytic subunit ClpP
MPIPMKAKGAKPYNIVVNDEENSAEINLYGEVVSSRPVDWWTGEPVSGNFIAVDELLRDLDELNSKDNITVHINSVGGEFYAGLAIYNRLRNLKASVTTINDGLAASAGSIIFMAGDKGKRKVHAGSNLMIHGVLNFLYGYYNAIDLKAEIKELESHNKAAIAAYVEATGLDQETVKAAMSKDTYMTGQEAVDAGWADEVITGEGVEPVNMKLTPDKSRLMVNGHAVAACLFGKLPEGIPEMTAEEFAALSTTDGGAELPKNSEKPAPQARNNNTSENGGNANMEIKNASDLRKAYPDFVAEIESAAQANATAAERQRIQGIEEISNAIGDAALVKNAKYGEKPMNAQELAFAAMKAQAAIGNKVVNGMTEDAKASGAADVVAAPAQDPKNMNDDEQAEALLIGAIKNKKEDK